MCNWCGLCGYVCIHTHTHISALAGKLLGMHDFCAILCIIPIITHPLPLSPTPSTLPSYFFYATHFSQPWSLPPPASKLTHTMFYFVVYKFLVYTVTNFKTKIILDFYCSQSLPNCIKRSFFLFVSQIFFVNPCNRFIYAKFV